EEKEDFSPAVQADIEEMIREPKTELEKVVKRINRALKGGDTAYEIVDDIQKLPRPIVVDFNNVIINGCAPHQLNPDAPNFLEQLRQIGTVFIITGASSWDDVRSILHNLGVWSNDIVLMTQPTFEFISREHRDDPRGQKLRSEYLATARKQGWDTQEEDLLRPVGYKYVAPIFNQPFLIPIIDDAWQATDNNPGMLGVPVQCWEPNVPRETLQLISEGRITLAEAVESVRNHYKNH
ncbi:hypothetical protein KGQ71_04990, partial [Patescibacteria group bacterium]|nr:hypothetical protein [Patescibacteria group bacterium]